MWRLGTSLSWLIPTPLRRLECRCAPWGRGASSLAWGLRDQEWPKFSLGQLGVSQTPIVSINIIHAHIRWYDLPQIYVIYFVQTIRRRDNIVLLDKEWLPFIYPTTTLFQTPVASTRSETLGPRESASVHRDVTCTVLKTMIRLLLTPLGLVSALLIS